METQPCILYYDRRSICSSMVRYTLASAGLPGKNFSSLSTEPREIDIFNGEQLSESYLCEVNPKGQVPVLLSPGLLEKPITDSLDITLWLCERHPDLRPSEYADDINRLLRDLHAINFFTLSMRNRPQRAELLEGAIRAKMDTPDLSARHKKALEYKLTVTRSEKVEGVRPEVITEETERARALLNDIDGTRRGHNGEGLRADAWIFGTAAPTALDTTLICFLARLMDVQLEEIIPSALLEMGRAARETDKFKGIWTSL
ncbi:uncharacterized protein PV07_07448 [Cladophialophora immunda]|uniref:GST N-terminal domain-containing protein n=1 Tax=Cladophialophora immunda TaxID=569365 RepID=A0A0D2C9E5_9EURO|nr:uncharacterized protein PV07_07448 [Cladophialophora immunda]KIW27738.1 hypothetical protein PV07_07448 [Cladophialophora immunda]OQV10048.1 Glutathione S-transferase, domain-containing protein [Cladophialophora immunda]